MKKLVIAGAGGAGIEALWVARRMNANASSPIWEIVGFLDDNPEVTGVIVDDVPIIGTVAQFMKQPFGVECSFHVAIGSNRHRQRIAEIIEQVGVRPATLIDPTAIISPSALIGEGSYIAPSVFIGPHAKLGRHVLVNVGGSVGHDSEVHDFAQLCPGARVSGKAALGIGSFIGSNGVVAPGVRFGEWTTLGAASFAPRDLPSSVTAVGVPAKILAVPPSLK